MSKRIRINRAMSLEELIAHSYEAFTSATDRQIEFILTERPTGTKLYRREVDLQTTNTHEYNLKVLGREFTDIHWTYEPLSITLVRKNSETIEAKLKLFKHIGDN